MGAINYHTSKYITISLEPLDYENYLYYDEEYEEEKTDYDLMELHYEFYHEEIKSILDGYRFYYFHVSIETGYYEGFSIDIDNNFPVFFDDYIEKREAQKEITTIKYVLKECVKAGLVQCFPGWCTGYSDQKESLKAINEAIKEMREEVKHTPTWKQYNKEV